MSPSYLSPGVYMEEVDKGTKPIEAVGTAVAALPRSRLLPALPERFQRLVVAELIRPQLQNRLRPVLRPELLGALDPPVDLLDHRLH